MLTRAAGETRWGWGGNAMAATQWRQNPNAIFAKIEKRTEIGINNLSLVCHKNFDFPLSLLTPITTYVENTTSLQIKDVVQELSRRAYKMLSNANRF